jgi:hypothetical protein
MIHGGYERHPEEAQMHPFLQAQLAALHENDLRADAEAARGRARVASHDAKPVDVVIRRSTSADGPTLAVLSALDSAPLPFGPALVAEVGGVPRAVLPLDGGPSFGDPFAETDELVALLELRRAQIRHEQRAGEPPSRARRMLAMTLPATLRRLV